MTAERENEMRIQPYLRQGWDHFSTALEESRITQAIRSFDSVLSRLGNWIDFNLQRVGPRRRYFTEVLLRLPQLFIIHQWCLLSPTSEYCIIEVFLLILRYSVVMGYLIGGDFRIHSKTMIPMHIATIIHMLFGWLLELNYWMYQNEVDGMCTTWWDGKEVPWFGLSFCTITLQFLYITYLYQKTDTCKNITAIEACILTATFISHLFCMSAVFINISVPLFYWLTKVVFMATWCKQIEYYHDYSTWPAQHEPNQFIYVLNYFIRGLMQLLSELRLVRDVGVAFTLTFYWLCIVVDAVCLYPTRIVTWSYFTTFVGNWCTTSIIVAGISFCFEYLLNLSVALCRFLVTGQKEFTAVIFNVNIGASVRNEMYLFCLEAAVLYVDEETRIQNFKGVVLLTCYRIINRLLVVMERQFYMVFDSGRGCTVSAYLRILLFVAAITFVPVIVIFKMAYYLQLDVWMLLNTSGTLSILIRALCSLVEVLLGSLAWHVDNYLDKVEDLMYYTGLFKNFAFVVTDLMSRYHRLFSPLFSQGFYMRLVFIISDGFIYAYFTLHKEWIVFQNRRQFLKRLEVIPDASEEQLRELNDVCAICFAELKEGKVLRCSHIFHKSCVRKLSLSQLQSSCPLCRQTLF